MQCTLINLFVFTILLTSLPFCSKPNEPTESEWYVIAKKDGVSWRGEAFAGIDNEGILVINGTIFNAQSLRREKISWWTPITVGVHLPSEGFYATYLDDGDVLGHYFRPLKQSPDSVAIVQYDSATGIISGSFSLRYKHESDSTWIITFTEGTFKAKLGVGRR